MRPTVAMVGLADVLGDIGTRFDKAQLAGLKEAASGLKDDLVGQSDGIVGPRVAKAWRAKTYDNKGRNEGPAAFVWSKAPKIISFHTADQVVRAVHGKFLAIPTDDAPKKGGGGRMSVAEVEARFGKRIVFIGPDDRGFHTPSQRRAGIAFLVLKDLVVRKASQRYRNASAREKASGRKPLSAVIMFVLVPQVRGHKQIDLAATADRWAGQAVELILANLGDGS